MSIERKEWKRAPSDWPRQLPEVDEREVVRERRPARDAEAAEERESGPAVRGTRTQTGRGSTSGYS